MLYCSCQEAFRGAAEGKTGQTKRQRQTINNEPIDRERAGVKTNDKKLRHFDRVCLCEAVKVVVGSPMMFSSCIDIRTVPPLASLRILIRPRIVTHTTKFGPGVAMVGAGNREKRTNAAEGFLHYQNQVEPSNDIRSAQLNSKPCSNPMPARYLYLEFKPRGI